MPNQKEWDKTFIEIARIMAEKSKCSRLKVGAVITKDNRIIGCGYNGTPSGFINCNEACENLRDNKEQSEHHLFSEQYEIHAEMNAILDLAKRGLSPEGSTLYTTICPCKNCAKLVIAAGIKRIIFDHYYDRDIESQVTNFNRQIIIDNKRYFKEYNGADIINLLGHYSKSSIDIEQYHDS